MDDQDYLEKAIELSQRSIRAGGFPVGALVVLDDRIVGEGISDGKALHDATLHAEIDAIRRASSLLKTRDLKGAVIYTSMEPCLMCFSACYWAKIEKIVYAVPKTSLPAVHYEGLHDLHEIDAVNGRHIEIAHIQQLEHEALAVITEWEQQK